MSKLYTSIFDKKRLDVWERLVVFRDVGVLAGGTGLALQLNHRVSYDFDIFCESVIKKTLLKKVKEVFWENELEVRVDSGDELTLLIDGEVKLSFVYFPFKPLGGVKATESLSIFDVRDLVANKAYAVGRRGVWRDYVDLGWCLKQGLVSLEQVIDDSKKKFGELFSKRLFLEQLVYFNDLEDVAVEWVSEGMTVSEVKKFLAEEVKKCVG